MQRIWQGGMLALGVLAGSGTGQAQLWPLHTGPGGDVILQATRELDQLRRAAPVQPDPSPRVVIPAPAWTPPPPPPPVRRAAAPRSTSRVAKAAAPATAPAVTPGGRQPDIEAVERRMAERERILRDLQRELAEERRLVEEWRGAQRAAR